MSKINRRFTIFRFKIFCNFILDLVLYTFTGIRLLDGNVDDDAEAVAFSFANDHIDIYAIAFGPDDDGKTVDGPGPKAMEAIARAIKMV